MYRRQRVFRLLLCCFRRMRVELSAHVLGMFVIQESLALNLAVVPNLSFVSGLLRAAGASRRLCGDPFSASPAARRTAAIRIAEPRRARSASGQARRGVNWAWAVVASVSQVFFRTRGIRQRLWPNGLLRRLRSGTRRLHSGRGRHVADTAAIGRAAHKRARSAWRAGAASRMGHRPRAPAFASKGLEHESATGPLPGPPPVLGRGRPGRPGVSPRRPPRASLGLPGPPRASRGLPTIHSLAIAYQDSVSEWRDVSFACLRFQARIFCSTFRFEKFLNISKADGYAASLAPSLLCPPKLSATGPS
jgi:hypothetical protein